MKQRDFDPCNIDIQWFAEGGGDTGGDSFAGTVAADPTQTTDPKPDTQGEQSTELPGWSKATTKELRADPRFAAFAPKYKSFDDVVKNAIEMESRISGMTTIPTDKSTPEEIAEFYQKLGVPKTAEDYELPAEDASEDGLKEFRDLAHRLNLTNAQAKEVFTTANEAAQKALIAYDEQQKASNDAAYQACETNLKQEWGDAFTTNIAVAQRGLRAFGSPELLADAKRSGMGNSPAFLKLFYALGQSVSEDSSNIRGARGGERKSPADILYPSKE